MNGFARQGDSVTASDVHVLPNGSYTSAPFSGKLLDNLATSVKVNGRQVALDGSVAINSPPHPPPIVASNRGTVSATRSVTIEGRPVACQGDVVKTCNDPADLPFGSITSGSPNVLVGGSP